MKISLFVHSPTQCIPVAAEERWMHKMKEEMHVSVIKQTKIIHVMTHKTDHE